MNIKAIIEISFKLKKINDEQHFVPDYFLAQFAQEYNVSIEECREIRDIVQSIYMEEKI